MAAQSEHLRQHIRNLVLPPSSEMASEAELLARFVHRKDEDAFAALVARHGPMVFAVCCRTLRDVHQAEDVAQATFLVLAQKAETLHRPDTLAAWLHRTARYLALKQQRSDARRKAREVRSCLAAPVSPPDLLDELSVRELLAIFDEEVQQLPQQYRLPLILCCLEGRTQEEVARQLGWTPGAVKGRLERGRAQLQQRLSRRGLSLSAAMVALETTPALPSGFLARALADGPLATQVVALASEGIRSTVTTRMKVVVALLLTVGAVATGVAALAQSGLMMRQRGAMSAKTAKEKEQARRDRDGKVLPQGALARLGTLRWRAAGEVEALAFTPDGKTVVSLSPRGRSANRGLCLFDVATDKRTSHIRPTDTFFGRIAVSPTGTQVLCGCKIIEGEREKNTVQIRELPGGRILHEFNADNLQWLGWSPDARPLALFQAKGVVRLRELVSGKELQFKMLDLPDPIRGLASCAYAARGKVLAVPDERQVIHIWDTATGKQRWALQAKGTRVRSLALSADGRFLASLSYAAGVNGPVQLWDLATGKATRTLAADQKYLHAVAFTPDGKTLATIGWTEIRFHDVATGQQRNRARGVKSFAPGVAFSPDGKTLATAEMYSNTIHLWDVATASLKPNPLGHTNSPWQLAFSPDGRHVASGGEVDGTIIVWDVAMARPLVQVRRGGWVRGCAFSRDGRTLLSCWGGDILDVSDVSSGRQLHTMKLDDPDRPGTEQSGLNMYLSLDRKTLVAFSDTTARKTGAPVARSLLVTGWDTTTRKQLFRRRRGRVDYGMAVSPEARILAVAQGDDGQHGKEVAGVGPVRLEDLASGEHLLSLRAIEGQTRPLAFSPDGQLLATNTFGQTHHTLRLWEVMTAREVLALPSVINARVAFSSDSRLLALSAPGRKILVWDLRQGKQLRKITGLDADVTSLAFSPDGRRLVSGLSDTTLLVWDVADLWKVVKPTALDAAGAAQAWADLGGDARKAFAARGALALSPQTTVSLLKERLKPVASPKARRVQRLVTELDSDRFAVREEARKALEALGDQASGALQQALAKKPSLEAHRRIKSLLARLRIPIAQPEVLQALRAVMVLEDIATAQAQEVLQALARGEPQARLTLAAKTSLQRLASRPAGRP
jgi:RNA polymerase sigma factor (sigma-70 family)